MRGSIKALQASIMEVEDSQIGMMISVIWHPRYLGFEENYDRAKGVGERLSGVVAEIVRSLPQGSTHLLCHSMGARVLEGMAEVWTSPEINAPEFGEVLLAAPDIDSDAFGKEGSLENARSLAQRFTIYQHKKDRILQLSKFFLDEDRLGIEGPEDWEEVSAPVYLVNVTDVDNDIVTNHLYFQDSDDVLRDFSEVLAGVAAKDISRRFAENEQEYRLIPTDDD